MTIVARFGETGFDDVPVACLAADDVGDWMHIRGDQTTTGRWRVEKADCFDETKMPAVGILISKSTPTTGIMRRVGPVDEFTGLDFTKHYFVGPAGSMVNPAPTPPSGTYVVVQRVGIPVDPDIIYLTGEIGPLFKLVDL